MESAVPAKIVPSNLTATAIPPFPGRVSFCQKGVCENAHGSAAIARSRPLIAPTSFDWSISHLHAQTGVAIQCTLSGLEKQSLGTRDAMTSDYIHSRSRNS